MCGVKDEMVGHLLCECSKMAQIQYKHRHDNVARIVHWAIAKQRGLDVEEKWYEHKPEPVIENANIKMLWDFTIQTLNAKTDLHLSKNKTIFRLNPCCGTSKLTLTGWKCKTVLLRSNWIYASVSTFRDFRGLYIPYSFLTG